MPFGAEIHTFTKVIFYKVWLIIAMSGFSGWFSDVSHTFSHSIHRQTATELPSTGKDSQVQRHERLNWVPGGLSSSQRPALLSVGFPLWLWVQGPGNTDLGSQETSPIGQWLSSRVHGATRRPQPIPLQLRTSNPAAGISNLSPAEVSCFAFKRAKN